MYNLPQFDLSRVTYVRSSAFRFLVFRVLRCIKCLSIKKTTAATWLSCVIIVAQFLVKCTSACDCAGKEANFA